MIIIRYFVYIILKSNYTRIQQILSKLYLSFGQACLLNEYIYIIHIIYTIINNINRVLHFCFGFFLKR